MSILDQIVALFAAVHRNDIAATARLLDRLERQMDPEALADILEAVFGDGPPQGAGAAAPAGPVACV